jgi:hypothetical protein
MMASLATHGEIYQRADSHLPRWEDGTPALVSKYLE